MYLIFGQIITFEEQTETLKVVSQTGHSSWRHSWVQGSFLSPAGFFQIFLDSNVLLFFKLSHCRDTIKVVQGIKYSYLKLNAGYNGFMSQKRPSSCVFIVNWFYSPLHGAVQKRKVLRRPAGLRKCSMQRLGRRPNPPPPDYQFTSQHDQWLINLLLGC